MLLLPLASHADRRYAPRLTLLAATMSMGVMDMRASLQARASLENDVRNLKVAVDSKDMSHVEPESKVL